MVWILQNHATTTTTTTSYLHRYPYISSCFSQYFPSTTKASHGKSILDTLTSPHHLTFHSLTIPQSDELIAGSKSLAGLQVSAKRAGFSGSKLYRTLYKFIECNAGEDGSLQLEPGDLYHFCHMALPGTLEWSRFTTVARQNRLREVILREVMSKYQTSSTLKERKRLLSFYSVDHDLEVSEIEHSPTH